MNPKKITPYLFTLLLFSFSSCTGKWDEIKKSKEVYPTDTLTAYNFKVLDFIERRWINKAYKDYKYKSYCPRKVEFRFDAASPGVWSLLSGDTLGLAKFLQADMQKQGICHLVAQTLSYNKLTIYFYLEDELFPFETENKIRVQHELFTILEPDWKSYSLLEAK